MKEKPNQVLKYSVHTRLREFHLRRLLPESKPGRLLDVGCGLGYLTQSLGQGYTKVGLEFDKSALLINQKCGLLNLVQGDAARLPFQDESFDLVICSEVLEHLPDGEDERALYEMARVLRPGRRLLITVPSLEGLRAHSTLRNLGHDDPSGGEYHYRIGYTWPDLKAVIDRCPRLKLHKRRHSMFLFSELFMDALKWMFLRKNKMKDHADLIVAKNSLLFQIYRFFFPFIHFLFLCEDITLASLFKGHILVLSLERLADA